MMNIIMGKCDRLTCCDMRAHSSLGMVSCLSLSLVVDRVASSESSD
jgi:hypothetical protein